MIVCPNCNHANPEGATQCEACYTPLPTTTNCPNCGASVQTDATFCGQCGFNLQPQINPPEEAPETLVNPPELSEREIFEREQPEAIPSNLPDSPLTASVASEPSLPPSQPTSSPSPPPQATPAASFVPTQLQIQTASLLNTQTQTRIEFPQSLSVIHIGKPNDQIPPDIDVSGFPDAEIVSRIHADIRVEGDSFYLEDVGSSNGTYVNHTALPPGNRHRLRSGDRIALGKGDKMTFIFQLS
ncbi:MAG: FHA domain-containing protein [Microcystaceae cyanobacterium]